MTDNHQTQAVVEAGSVRFGNHLPLSIIAGPCAMESRDHALDRGGSEGGQISHAGQHHLESFRSEEAVTVGQSAVERPTAAPEVTRGAGIGRLGDHPDR